MCTTGVGTFNIATDRCILEVEREVESLMIITDSDTLASAVNSSNQIDETSN